MTDAGKRKNLKRRIGALVMCVAFVLTSIQAPPVTAAAAELPDDLSPVQAFVLKDSNFEYGIKNGAEDGVDIGVQNQSACWEGFRMQWEGYSTKATFTPEDGGVTVKIDDVGANGEYAGWWTVALQQNTRVYAGRTYKVSFDLSSSISRGFAYGMQDPDDSDINIWREEIDGIREAMVGEKQTFTYTFSCQETRDALFYINLGAPAKDNPLEPHTVKISNVKMEVEGAREQFVLVDENTFEAKENPDFTMQGGTAVDKYASLNNGKITFPDLSVTEGREYELSFMARSDQGANISASLGVQAIVQNKAVGEYASVYKYKFEAAKTGTMDLEISASGGTVLIDNIGLWHPEVPNALGLSNRGSELALGGITLEADEINYQLGTDVSLTAKGDNIASWLAADHELLVGSDVVPGELYTIQASSSQAASIAIEGSVFENYGLKTYGTARVSIRTGGFSDISVEIKLLEPNGNLLENGDFSDGFASWSTYFNERHSGSAELVDENAFMVKITINFFLNWYDEQGNDNGPVIWSTQLNHDKVAVQAGKKYKVRFWANSTVERPIMLAIGEKKYFFKLTSEMQEYTAEYDNTWGGSSEVDFSLQLGPISESENQNNTGIGYTKTDGHSMLFADFSMVEVTGNEDQTYVKMPVIVGIDEDATYGVPVSAKVNYRNPYTITLQQDGRNVPYTEGDLIKDDAKYVMTVADNADPKIKVTREFTIKKEIDYTKTYYILASKATERVVEATGMKDGGAVVQSTFKGKPGQLFTMEELYAGTGDYIFRALSTGKVLQVAKASRDNGAKIEQAEYTGADNQLWNIVNVPQGYVKIKNVESSKVLDIPNAAQIEDLPLQQYDNSGNGDEGQNSADGQRFDLIQITDVKQYMETPVSPVASEADWKEKAFITPIAGELNPAGSVAVEWYTLPDATVNSYDLYFDGKKCKRLDATDDETMKSEDQDIYTTDVAAHTMKIVANCAGGKTVETDAISFYISKKGVGWGTLHRTQNMNLSWYYHWALAPSLGMDGLSRDGGNMKNLTFVPMIWGNYGDEWLADPANKKWGTVLSFNEPDWSDQSNVPVTIESAKAWAERYNKEYNADMAPPKSVEESWQAFMDSGLRVGSPATALAPPYCNGTIEMNKVDGPDNWWFDFQDLMDSHEGWDYDFTAIHSYNDACDAKGFLRMIDETYKLTKKPIWITEFGVAEWNKGLWNPNEKTRQQVKEFMIEVINGLEERDFVERYAWFPFDPNDAYGGASGIFDYSTGELNELGKTYAMLGLPEGYEGAAYDVDLNIPDVPAEKVTIDKTNVNTNAEIGSTITLTVTPEPAGTTDEAVWSSDHEDIATVNGNGEVTFLKEGTVTITVTMGDATDTITFFVSGIAVENINIDKSKTQMYVGDEMTLHVTVNPANAGNKNVTFKSSNDAVAAVDQTTGKVTAKSVGEVVITATSVSNQAAIDIISIKVVDKPVSQSTAAVLDVKAGAQQILVGQTTNATAALSDKTGTVTWSSSNEAAAVVDANGVIKGVAPGRASISATCGTSTKSIEITVVKPTIKWNVSYKTCPLQLKKSTTALKAIGLQSGDSIASYKSSNQKVASISRKGKIKAKKIGTARITVTTKYGAAAAIRIKVVKKPVKVISISVNKRRLSLRKGKSYRLSVTKKYITSLYKVTYDSSNPTVATVSQKGVIRGKKKGRAVITVRCQGKKKKVKVTVK